MSPARRWRALPAIALPAIALPVIALPAIALAIASLLPCAGTAGTLSALPPVAPPGQAAEYQAETAKTIIELQQFRVSATLAIEGSGARRGQATLIDLNPRINAWYLLVLDWGGSGGSLSYHLENPDPAAQTLRLAAGGIEIGAGGAVTPCPLWSADAGAALETARRSAQPYAPLCGNRLYLRNRQGGSQTSLERATDFLRDYVWGGQTIVDFVRQQLYRDAYIEEGAPGTPAGKAEPPDDPAAPRPAALEPRTDARPVVPVDLGIDLGRPMRSLAAGRWYPLAGLGGIYFSFVQPRNIATEILKSHRDHVNGLDEVEAGALDYLVAFDLAAFDLGFVLGTDHPRVGWSDRPHSDARGKLPGPDGIATSAPLVTSGMISPALAPRVAATFTGGFKRQHGAFKYGAFAARNHGSHYGFIEQGTVFSKLQPGLATVTVLDDGSVGMKSWTEQDDSLLGRIKFARQNGVPLIDVDAASGASVPGALVAQWGPGNWSGTAEEKLRSLRAGLCLQEANRRFLIYGYFSSATPSAMARVFQAYGCRYAMHLDMNALEHTYLALYLHRGAAVVVEHLVQGMALIDKKSGDTPLPRFLAYPDDRDFFYLTRKESRS